MKSPGVPGETLLVASARARSVPVWSEIELGARLLPNPILGVTGTNGKTTTTELLGAVFRSAGTPVEVAGNVGRPLTSLVGSASPEAWVVCELSSFQLEDVETLRPRVAVLLNLEPDHLDRHGSFEAYADVKLRIFERQGAEDTAVVPRAFGPIPGAGASRRASQRTTSFPPSHSSRARTTARTPRRRPPRLVLRGSTTRPSPTRCARSRAFRTASSSSASSAALATSTTRRRRTSQPRSARWPRSPTHGCT